MSSLPLPSGGQGDRHGDHRDSGSLPNTHGSDGGVVAGDKWGLSIIFGILVLVWPHLGVLALVWLILSTAILR